ncbi:MAG: methyltransferase domain-containing protein, partial [Deltaproteobacteria bacterium]|nr:methyltransferase domain-containing protein [Deltaproteobacteria bacterium]
CPWWLAYTFDNRLRSLIHRPGKVLSPYIRPGMTVMDVGCGMGHFSIGMAGLVGDEGLVISVDLQDEMLGVVNRRAEKAGVNHRTRTYQCTTQDIGDHGALKRQVLIIALEHTSAQHRISGTIKTSTSPWPSGWYMRSRGQTTSLNRFIPASRPKECY